MQFLFLRSIKPYVVFLLTSMLLFTTGCKDDDHDDHDHEEGHTDADGFILEDEAGNVMYREFEGAMTGSVTLAVGDTLELSVHFLDHEGNEIEHSEEEGEGAAGRGRGRRWERGRPEGERSGRGGEAPQAGPREGGGAEGEAARTRRVAL